METKDYLSRLDKPKLNALNSLLSSLKENNIDIYANSNSKELDLVIVRDGGFLYSDLENALLKKAKDVFGSPMLNSPDMNVHVTYRDSELYLLLTSVRNPKKYDTELFRKRPGKPEPKKSFISFFLEDLELYMSIDEPKTLDDDYL